MSTRDDKENYLNEGGMMNNNNNSRNQKKFAMVNKDKGGVRGLKVWFPSKKNAEQQQKNVVGRKITPDEEKVVVDNDQKAMFYHQVEENAQNRQLLGKTLYAQGKYDAALALFSLSVKLREDNGLKNAKTTAIAHTDVASAFIHLDDAKNAEKHLMIAKRIFEKACFSGGKANLGDVFCFLGVVMDMTDDLQSGEMYYRKALQLYEECHAQQNNPNWDTAIDNLKANMRRQKLAKQQKATGVRLQRQEAEQGVGRKSIRKSTARLVSNARRMSKRMSAKLVSRQQVLRAKGPLGAQQSVGNTYNQSSSSKQNQTALNVSNMSKSSRGPSQPNIPRQKRKAPSKESISTDSSSLPISESPTDSYRSDHRRRSGRNTWRDLAETARASVSAIEAAVNAADGSYEGLSCQWQQDGREKMAAGQYIEAKDTLLLAVYTRKRHGPWNTLANAECHEDLARVLFALSCSKGISKEEAKATQREAAGYLRTCVELLEVLNDAKAKLRAGEVWGNLGLVLDRLGNIKEAETAHTRGLVYFGIMGVDQAETKWKKAFKNWRKNIEKQGKDAAAKWGDIQAQVAAKRS